ncbi:MAG: quinolinate synthase NadA [Candidatus Cyclobacteriaceae bacterium M2_1C_046]
MKLFELKKAQDELVDTGYLNIPIDKKLDLKEEIIKLKREKNALLLTHYYQRPEIQDLADFTGDSLELTKHISHSDKQLVVFAGVYFMAETAKIMNPQKKIIIPDLNSGCSLEESCPPDKFKKFVEAHPDHTVVTYMNCSAGVKALSDIVCTSSSAVKIINSIPKDQPIIFAPDVNLGKYLIKETGRDMLLWDGSCIVHESFSIDKLITLHAEHPEAEIIAHPESEPHILRVSSFVGSTSTLINYIEESPKQQFIVATEGGILHEITKRVPQKTIIPAPVYDETSCSCSECAYMKLNTLQKLYLCLKFEQPEVFVDEDLRKKALVPINRMFKINNQ